MKTLVYCGIHDGDGFAALLDGFDVAYGFDANPDKAAAAAERFAARRNVAVVHGALCDRTGGTVGFNITEAWDASSSMGLLRAEFPHMTDAMSPLHGTTVRRVEVPAINLGQFLELSGVERVDLLVTDLQGMDLTVLRTLSGMIRGRRIAEIVCEAEKDDMPNIYDGLSSNKLSDFHRLLGRDYTMVEYTTEPAWWEGDARWVLR